MSEEWLRSDLIMSDADSLMKAFDRISDGQFLCPEQVLDKQMPPPPKGSRAEDMTLA
eukprot:CAMPEP_0114162186 /NCGR_PEP_ID=MMETSP0043_2-20121206/29363_1 /TAXON_ID=464988 /ORGANISM="Hemiselmis andersenii, Strain CCMP644" /LENGTH=56 /DNA_ID=CAMNT_0001258489 /DNA_START=42 /DNA_END=209 /DNA_ORIENTATION=-